MKLMSNTLRNWQKGERGTAYAVVMKLMRNTLRDSHRSEQITALGFKLRLIHNFCKGERKISSLSMPLDIPPTTSHPWLALSLILMTKTGFLTLPIGSCA